VKYPSHVCERRTPPTTLLFLPSGTPICRNGIATPNPTQTTQSELPGLLKGVNPVRPVNLTRADPATSTTVYSCYVKAASY